VATSQTDSSLTGSLALTIVPITTAVAPATVNVGLGPTAQTQQFTAVALPDNAPQQFTWTCTIPSTGATCANFTPGANGAGTATYTASAIEECGTGCVQIAAAATGDPTGCSFNSTTYPCTVGQVTVVASRLSGTYAFHFSGFDSSSHRVAVAGTFTVSNGVITGVEDELTSNGPQTGLAISGGSYAPATATDPNDSNNLGVLTLTLPAGVYPNQYQVVLDAAGDVQMLEADGHGTGAGIAEAVATGNKFNSTAQTFAFGFTGADSGGNRIGYAGLLPMTPSASCSTGIIACGTVSGGLIDVNDHGNSSNSICSAAPCNVAGNYQNNGNGSWTLTLMSPIAMSFDFFIANGNSTSNNPLNLYAISTDSNPGVLGTMVLQDSKITYNNAGFKSTSVSVLNGANDSVSLTLGSTDGNGNFSGQFDWNNSGTEVSVPSSSPFAYTYAAVPLSGSQYLGRYTFQMLGNPGANPVVQPLTFVLYASGANRGFLLDQSSSAVVTGAMIPQVGPKQNSGIFANTLLPGTYAVATNRNDSASIAPLTMNLLLTSPGNSVFNVSGAENPGNQPITGGTYNVQAAGTGTLSTTTGAGTAHYIFYAVNATTFYMIQDASKDSGVTSPLLLVAQ
jgi:hypothetical protein